MKSKNVLKLKGTAKRELRSLDNLSNEFMHEVELALGKIRKTEVKLWLVQQDRYKLLRLRVWKERYRVDLVYILQVLIPFWENFVQRRSKKMKKEGLNVRVGTLTGKKSESILVDQIKKDYPDNLQKTLFIASERQRLNILNDTDQDEFRVKRKSLLDYSTPRAYVTAYRRKIKEQQKEREHFALVMQQRPYRGNPFTPGRV